MQDIHGKLSPRIVMAKAAFNKKVSFHQHIVIKFTEEIRKCYIWSVAVYGAESLIRRKRSQIPGKF
jgi:hypothetical protein